MSRLVWIDLETGGLHTESIEGIGRGSLHYPILEVAIIVTDENLKPIGNPYRKAIYYPHSKQYMKESIYPWSYKQFKDTLIPECLDKSRSTPIDKAEVEALNYLAGKGVKAGESPLYGNSITLDRMFLLEHMPKLESFLHYRNVDVSSFKEVFKITHGITHVKKNTHEALSDIEESIEELKFYLSFFRGGPDETK